MKRICIIMLLLTVGCFAKTKPPVLDPNECPYPYDPNILTVASPMAWLPAEIDVSVISQIHVWNKSGVPTAVTVEEVQIIGDEVVIVPFEYTFEPLTGNPVADPNGGYSTTWTWGFTPNEPKVYYFLFTASTPSKPNWQTDQRIVMVYVTDPPILWVQDVPVLTTRDAQRLWQYAKKLGHPMTKPTLVRMAKAGR